MPFLLFYFEDASKYQPITFQKLRTVYVVLDWLRVNHGFLAEYDVAALHILQPIFVIFPVISRW